MPRLLIFAPCEKVAIDNQNNPILISVLQEWGAQGVTELPENALTPQPWEIFALWYRMPDDEDREFVQTCELKGPSGRILLSGQLAFRMTAIAHRNTMRVMGLPVNPGEYELTIYLSEKGSEKARELLSAYPLLVRPPSA